MEVLRARTKKELQEKTREWVRSMWLRGKAREYFGKRDGTCQRQWDTLRD